MRLIHSIPKGTPCYVHPLTREVIGTCVSTLDIYYDSPAEEFTLNMSSLEANASRLRQIFPCKLAGVSAHVLIDTGASHNFIDPSFAEACGFTVTPDSGRVYCGGNNVSTISGSCRLQLKLGKSFCKRVQFYVTKTPTKIPVILGNTWINQYEVDLCHGKIAKVKMRVDGTRLTIRNPAECSLKEGAMDDANFSASFSYTNQSDIPLVSAMNARELIKDGGTPYLLSIKQTDTAESPPAVPHPKAQSLLTEFQDLFQPLPSGLPPDRGCPFHIDTDDSKPVFMKTNQVSPHTVLLYCLYRRRMAL